MVHLSVGRSVCHDREPCKTAELIEMPLSLWTLVLRNHVLDGGAHWRHLANMIEPFVCGSDAAVLQMIDHFFHFFRTMTDLVNVEHVSVCFPS